MKDCCKKALEEHFAEKDRHFWKFLLLIEGGVILFMCSLFGLMYLMW